MGDLDAFGVAGGARGVLEEGQLVTRDVGIPPLEFELGLTLFVNGHPDAAGERRRELEEGRADRPHLRRGEDDALPRRLRRWTRGEGACVTGASRPAGRAALRWRRRTGTRGSRPRSRGPARRGGSPSSSDSRAAGAGRRPFGLEVELAEGEPRETASRRRRGRSTLVPTGLPGARRRTSARVRGSRSLRSPGGEGLGVLHGGGAPRRARSPRRRARVALARLPELRIDRARDRPGLRHHASSFLLATEGIHNSSRASEGQSEETRRLGVTRSGTRPSS